MNYDILTLVPFVLAVIPALFSLAAYVKTVEALRKRVPSDVELRVDELCVIVEKLLKDQRKATMKAVRAAAKEEAPAPMENTGLQIVNETAVASKKDELRQRARARGTMR